MKESVYAMKQATAKVGQLYSRILPEGWTNFELHAYYPAKAADEYYPLYSMDGGKTWKELMEDTQNNDDLLLDILDAQDAAKDLHALCEMEEDCWTELTYTLTSAGKFDCDFGYQKMDFVSMPQRKAWHDKAKQG